MQQSHLVPRDKFILLVDNRNDQRLIRLSDHKKFNWRKTSIPLASIAEHPFYTQFEVGNHLLTPIEWDFEEPQGDEEDEGDQANNNREIFTIQEAQRLQAGQIEQMKRELRPDEIISGLVENNEQFSKRSEYSKQKYLRKKERKYMFKVHAEPATLENVHQYYFRQEHRAIAAIRWDMLALLLLYASPLGRTLLAEQARGLLLGAALSRGAKAVTVANRERKALKNYPIVEQLNISKAEQERVEFASWSDLVANKEAVFDNFIALGNYNFAELITEVGPKLKEGGVIALFCQSLQPLLEAGRAMREKKYLSVRLQDSWCREYQVLHNRTHPLMYMDSSSGYLLTAFKVTE